MKKVLLSMTVLLSLVVGLFGIIQGIDIHTKYQYLLKSIHFIPFELLAEDLNTKNLLKKIIDF
jgi:uncharacterized alpha/beta hydrolase family protein